MIRRAVESFGCVMTLVVLPVGLVVLCGVIVFAGGRHGSDFATFWDSGRAVLHGRSPYPALSSLPSAANRWFAPFVYPPVAAFSMIPLSLLPFPAANLVFFLLNVAALGLALRLLGVSDWRCYGIAYASVPMFAAAGIGTISPLLLLGVAAAWRYRDRAVAVGLVVAYVMTAKLFLWPLWLWLLRTRRFLAAAVAAGAAGTAVLVSWACIGFAGLWDYPRLLARLTELEGPHSYSLYSLARSLGAAPHAAQSLVYAVTVLAVAAAVVLVKGDRAWMSAALGISLLATPILWPHYLVLLFVPVALRHRRLSPQWIALLALWLDPYGWSGGNPLRIAGVLAFAAVVVGIGIRRGVERQERSGLTAGPEPSLP